MKFKPFIPFAALTILAASCTQPDRTVEYPLIETANTMTLDIAKVELSDTATILHTDAYFRPHYWIKISSDSYLRANGKKYALKSTQGIEADSLFWMPESGEASFRLTFEPLPKNTQSFDFIESDCPDCFKLFGISLTSSNGNAPTYEKPEAVPAELMKTDPNAAVPEPVFKVGESTIHIHLIGYRKELGNKMDVFVNTLFGQEPYSIPINEKDGSATLTIPQYGPAEAILVFGMKNGLSMTSGDVWLNPGETIESYLDLRTSGYRILARRAEKRNTPQPNRIQPIYTSGSYGNLINMWASPKYSKSYNMDLYSEEFADHKQFADYKQKAEKYIQQVTEIYHSLSDSVEHSQLPPLKKEINRLQLNQSYLTALIEGDQIREYNYRKTHDMWDYSKRPEGIEPISKAQIAAACKSIDINDPKLMLGGGLLQYTEAAAVLTSIPEYAQSLPDGLAKDLTKIIQLKQKADNVSLTEADFKMLKEMKNPFYLEALTSMQQAAQKKLAEIDSKAHIEPTPDVPNEKLLEAIIAPYKGKVVFIDFWNTWCGPCRMSIEANEPLKSSELKSDELVWIYIANETSPIVKYKSMIINIAGKHFRLNNEQWKYLCDKLKIDGIPSYVLVDKASNYQLRNDLRDHNLMKKTLKKMIQ